MISSQELSQVLIQITKDSSKSDEALDVFVSFLEENNLLSQLPHIIRNLEYLSKRERDFNTLIVESPFEISETLLGKIKEVSKAKDASVETVENKSLLGGFRATYKGFVVDGSARHNLQTLKKQLTK